jgi:hypothetical protein
MFRPMRRMERRRMVAVVGTAAVVGSHEASKQEAQMQQQEAPLSQEAPPPAPVPAPEVAPAAAVAPAPAGGSDITAQLEQLSQLHNAGVLSDQEFAEAKQKALAGG